MKAAKGGYRDIIRFLVQAGADVSVPFYIHGKSETGIHPLMIWA